MCLDFSEEETTGGNGVERREIKAEAKTIKNVELN
jgi:hypothetical protein